MPWYLTLMPDGAVQTFADNHDEELRLLRLMRLLKLDKFVPSVSLIDDVFRAKSRELRVTGYVAAVFWILFSTLMFFSNREGHGGPDVEDEKQNADRYRDVRTGIEDFCLHTIVFSFFSLFRLILTFITTHRYQTRSRTS